MTAAEAATAADLTRAGARRLLMTLQDQGYASFDGKRYALTPRVLELGFAWLSPSRCSASVNRRRDGSPNG